MQAHSQQDSKIESTPPQDISGRQNEFKKNLLNGTGESSDITEASPASPLSPKGPKDNYDEMTNDSDNSEEMEFKTTGYRWLVLLPFCGLISNLAIAVAGFAAYVGQIQTAYGVSTALLYFFIVMPTILYAPMNFGATWFFNKFKIHHVLFIASFLQLSGAWVRALGLLGGQGNAQFWPVLLGTFMVFTANPLVLNSINVVSNVWFADHERAKAIAIASLMVPLGTLLGFGIAGVFATGVDVDDPQDCFDRFETMLWVQNGIFTVPCVLVFIFVKEKPKTPPSKTALTFKQLSGGGVMQDLKELAKNRNFTLNAVTFVIMYGDYIMLGNVLTPLFQDQFTPTQISIIGALFVVSGVIGCYLIGIFIDKTQKHLRGIRFITIALTATYILAIVLIPLGILELTCVFSFLAGLVNVPILPSSYAYSGKLVPGTPPSVVTGLMMSGAQLFSFFASLLIAFLLGFGQVPGICFVVVTLLIASVCALCIDESKINADLAASQTNDGEVYQEIENSPE